MGVKVRERVKGSGVWWIFIDHEGRRKAKKIGSQELALEVKKKLEARITLGELNLGKRAEASVTFGAYSKKWLQFVKANRTPGTYERYEDVLRIHVLPALKDRPIDKITRGEIRNLIVKKKKVLKSVSLVRDVVSGIFTYAMDDEVVKDNPTRQITKRLNLSHKSAKKVDPLNDLDLAAFLETAREKAPHLYPLFFTAARTGMRLGELLALQWEDLDFEHRVPFEDGIFEERPRILVERTYRRGVYGTTKNGKPRQVDMSFQLWEVLRNHLLQEKRRAMREGLGEVSGLIFHRDGKVIEQNYVRRVFNRVLQAAGLRRVKFHALRHTFATLLLSRGESPVYVMTQMGHSSIRMTVDLYGGWIPVRNQMGVNRLDTQLVPQPTREKPEPLEIPAAYLPMVPKGRLELPRGNPH